MEKKSIWQEKNKKQEFPILTKDSETDILIIGGGITGLTTAYLLKDSNKKISLIEKDILGSGITGKTTAKITYLQGVIYQTLTNRFNKRKAKCYFDSQKEAISILKRIIKDNQISCDLEQADSIVFTMDDKNIEKIEKEQKILKEWGVKVHNVKNKQIKKGIKVKDTYTFHPLKYLNSIKEICKNRVLIYEKTLGTKIENQKDSYRIETNHGVITARIVIIACHYPFFLLPSLIPLKTYIKREYVNTAIVEEPKSLSAVSIDQPFHSIRYYNNYVIYGCEAHKLTSKIDYQQHYDKSRQTFSHYFKKEPEYTWMNQDIMSHDGLPFIGKIRKNMYLATAYQAWGMTNGIISAKVITDLIKKGRTPYQYLFDPTRNNLVLWTNSLLGSFHYMKAYIQALWKKNNPRYIKQKGIIYGVYQDKRGEIHKIKLICPHMKCSLVFNKEEETWDCPCHGSRFDLDGNLIEGPAKKNL